MSISSCPASVRCASTVYRSILCVLVFESSLPGCASPAYHWVSCSKHGQVSKHSSRKAQRAEAQVRFACHTESHLRHPSRPALLSAPSSLHFFVHASHQQIIIFLLTLAFRSTQELLFAFGLVCMFADYCQPILLLRSPADWISAWRPVTETVLLQTTAAEDGDNLSHSMSNFLSLRVCVLFFLSSMRETLYITAAGHYVRRSLTHFTVRIGPGGRRTAAASHLSRCAVGHVILPNFRLCNLLLVSSNPARCVLTGARANLEVEYLGTSESEVRWRLAEVP